MTIDWDPPFMAWFLMTFMMGVPLIAGYGLLATLLTGNFLAYVSVCIAGILLIIVLTVRLNAE